MVSGSIGVKMDKSKKIAIAVVAVIVVALVVYVNVYNAKKDAEERERQEQIDAWNEWYDSYGREESIEFDGWIYLRLSDIEIENNGHTSKVAEGRITNNGEYGYEFVKITVDFLDEDGKTIESEWTYAVGGEGLEPGESKSWSVHTEYNTDIVEARASVDACKVMDGYCKVMDGDL